MFDNFQL